MAAGLNEREKMRVNIRFARELLYRAGRNDRLRAFQRKEYRTLREALLTLEGEPAPVTEEDIDRHLAAEGT